MDDERREIGARIAAARRAAGLTQHELAQRLGVTPRSIQNYESGAIVPYKHLRRIEALAHRRVGWILSGDGDEGISATIRELETSIEGHYTQLQSQLDTLHEQIELLRQQREAGITRRGQARRPPPE